MPVETEPDDVDPEDLVRAMPHISPEDAAKVRDRTPGAREGSESQEGPSADIGDE